VARGLARPQGGSPPAPAGSTDPDTRPDPPSGRDLDPVAAVRPVLSLTEAAAYLGVSPRNLQRATLAGEIVPSLSGRRRVFNRTDLDDYRTTQTAPGRRPGRATIPDAPSQQIPLTSAQHTVVAAMGYSTRKDNS